MANQVRCLRCRDIAETYHQDDRDTCKCGAVEMLGGNIALRVGWYVRNTRDWYEVLGGENHG